MRFVITAWPHLKEADTTAKIMRSVCYALVPAYVWALLVFGWHAWTVAAACVLAAVATEAVCLRLRRAPVTVNDGSAVVSGLLLGAVLPPNCPLWLAALGGVFAMAIAKQAFGGLGANIWNPALLARAFLQNTRPDHLMSGDYPWMSVLKPGEDGSVWESLKGAWRNAWGSFNQSFADLNAQAVQPVDAVTRATGDATPAAALSSMPAGVDLYTGATALTAVHFPPADAAGGVPAVLTPGWNEILRTWVGCEGGTIGEVSAVLLLLGGLYLLLRKTITWEVPVFYLGTAALCAWLLPAPYKVGALTEYTAWASGPWLYHLGAGGLMLGAFFMATDMATRPLTPKGRMVFGVGCGVLTIAIRLYGGYPEGVCYAILIMNTCVPWIDSALRPRVYGTGGSGRPCP